VELSIRGAKARFAEAAAAAARGERVVATKQGHPFIERVPAQTQGGMDFDKADQIQKALGLDGITVTLSSDFDDPAFSRKVLDLPE
jgi:antitoxin (DNA-binding transcriptional repressor) of toxin-antitoxin stability system